MPVRAITFDFWRTLFRDNAGAERRRHRLVALAAAAKITIDEAHEAMRVAMREFHRVHVEEQRTLVPADAIPLLEGVLKMEFHPEVRDQLIENFATAILKHAPLPIDGAFDAVRAAACHVPVGVISDTGISPGSSLEILLQNHDMGDAFQSLSFSDVVGVSKPQSAMYHHAAHGLGVDVTEILHIGDLEPTDVAGALRVGARAALFGGDNDRFLKTSKAHHVYASWGEFIEELPAIVGASQPEG